MKFWLAEYKKIFFISGLSLISLMLNAVPSFAQDMTDPEDASFNCMSATNVMDCISQTQNSPLKSADPKSLITGLNSQSFGLTGPVNLSVRYDEQLAWILDGSYAQKFGNHFAIGLKGSYGPNEYRGNATLGFGITPNQQFKLTYEYLAQNLPFDFTSGNVNEWVNQNAFGGAYRYMFANNKFLKGVEISGSYTKANSKTLSNADVYDDNGNLTGVLERRIAGGQQQSGLASVIMTPFKYTIIKAGAGYSASSFDTQWDSNQSQSTIAYNIEASHLLTPKTLLSTSVNNSATSRAHMVKVSRILPANLEGTISGQYNVSHVDGIDNNGSVSMGLSYPAPKTYTNMFAGSLGDLKSWVQQPVIYNARVLAVAEEKLHKVGIDALKIPSQSVPVDSKMKDLPISDYFSFDKTVYQRIDYSISSITNLDGTPSGVDLKLGIQYQGDSYTAKLYSTDNIPGTAFTPGKYQVNITAQGFRNNSPNPITQTVNSFEIDILQNSGMDSANWTDPNSQALAPAVVGLTYGPVDLSKYVNGIDGETFTYTLKSNNSYGGWLQLSSDGKLYSTVSVTDEDQQKTNPVTIQVVATSKLSNNQANPNPKTFTIQITKANYLPPTWVADNKWPVVGTTDLPTATPGADYQYVNSFGSFRLNPYQGSPFLTYTLDPNQQPVTDPSKESLTFSILKSSDAIGSNDKDDCYDPNVDKNSQWLKIDPSSGTLSGIAPFNKSFCNVYIQVYSNLAGKPGILAVKKIPFTTPDFKLPKFTGDTFPDANTSQPYGGFNANPYKPGNGKAYITKLQVKVNGVYQDDNTDSWSNFKVISPTNCQNGSNYWLAFDKDDAGIIQANGNVVVPNADQNSSCRLAVSFYSEHYKNTITVGTDDNNTPPGNIAINSTAPIWHVPATVDVNYTGAGSTYSIPTASSTYVDPPKGKAQSDLRVILGTVSPFPSGAASIGTLDSSYNIVVTPNLQTDVVGENNKDSNANFQATADTGAGTSSSNTTFKLRAWAEFAMPALLKKLPNYKVDSVYPQPKDGTQIDLDPYSATSDGYFNKTTLESDSTQVITNNDQWAFRLDPTKNNCDFLTLTNGILKSNGPVETKAASCSLVIDVKTKKSVSATDWSDPNGGWTALPATVLQSDSSVPTWTVTNITNPIQFDSVTAANCPNDNQITNPNRADKSIKCVSLNDLLNTSSQIKSLGFTFAGESSISPDGNWQIVKLDSKESNPDRPYDYYLLRKTVSTANGVTIDASQISAPINLDIYATNSMTNNGFVQTFQNVPVGADDSNVNYQWKDPTTTFTYKSSSSDQKYDLTNSIKSYLINDPSTEIIGSKIVANGQVLQMRSGDWITANQNQLTVPAVVFSNPMPGYNAGNYPNNLCVSSGITPCNTNKIQFAVTSTANPLGKTLDVTNLLKIKIQDLSWSTNTSAGTKSIRFDAVMVDKITTDGSDGKDYINLNKYLASDPVYAQFSPDFTVRFKDGDPATSGDWQIKQSGGVWYLLRVAPTDTTSGKKLLDVTKITSAATVPDIIQTDIEDGTTIQSASKSLSVAVTPDNENIILMYYDYRTQPSTDPDDHYTFWVTPSDKGGMNNQAPSVSGEIGSQGGLFMGLKSCLLDKSNSAGKYCNDAYIINNDGLTAPDSLAYHAPFTIMRYTNGYAMVGITNCSNDTINQHTYFFGNNNTTSSWSQLVMDQSAIKSSDMCPNLAIKMQNSQMYSKAQGSFNSNTIYNLPDIPVKICTSSPDTDGSKACHK